VDGVGVGGIDEKGNTHCVANMGGGGGYAICVMIDNFSSQNDNPFVVSMRGFALNGGNSAHTTTTYLSYLLAYHFILRCIY
jgi:hypothetical protein